MISMASFTGGFAGFNLFSQETWRRGHDKIIQSAAPARTHIFEARLDQALASVPLE